MNENPLLSEIEDIAARHWQELDNTLYFGEKAAEWTPEHGLVLFGETRRLYEERRHRSTRLTRFTVLAILLTIVGVIGLLVQWPILAEVCGVALLVLVGMLWLGGRE